jgi:hypothetical protein
MKKEVTWSLIREKMNILKGLSKIMIIKRVLRIHFATFSCKDLPNKL